MKPDVASITGAIVAIGAIAGGLLLEGGKLSDIAQYTAALIVIGGTLGAVMIATPLPLLIGAGKRFASVFFDSSPDQKAVMEQLLAYAAKARRGGLSSLEKEVTAVSDPFLAKALNLAVDGADLRAIRSMLELEMDAAEHEGEAQAKVFESAGGFAPTVGIIGAVLGLIQVMKNLANIDEVGHGIAVSFVATVYGVALANLFFLPAAQKIKARLHAETQKRELICEGVAGIVEGLNPRLLQVKLDAFFHRPSEPATAE